MVVHDVSANGKSTGTVPASPRRASALLGAFGSGSARLHIDLCRLASAMCTRSTAAVRP